MSRGPISPNKILYVKREMVIVLNVTKSTQCGLLDVALANYCTKKGLTCTVVILVCDSSFEHRTCVSEIVVALTASSWVETQ